jgi:hypothetical protein
LAPEFHRISRLKRVAGFFVTVMRPKAPQWKLPPVRIFTFPETCTFVYTPCQGATQEMSSVGVITAPGAMNHAATGNVDIVETLQ